MGFGGSLLCLSCEAPSEDSLRVISKNVALRGFLESGLCFFGGTRGRVPG